ncbi:MAG: ferredoxin [Acidimicrobiia bacterium]|nr:ferredoxin [Acidimicrobiia bacterium]MDH5521391.1 ferredoxin [Acidimicrobiia bacterium]
MKVWIDQDLCTGDGLCVDRCPSVFVMLEDGIAYVRDEQGVHNEPGGSRDPAEVHPDHDADVIDAALICPGECIFIEVEVDTSEKGQPVLAGSSHG